VLIFVDLCLRGLALWRAAKDDKWRWFVALLVVNSVGVLPLVYLSKFDKRWWRRCLDWIKRR